MLDAFLRRAILIALISALPNVVGIASAHGGHSGGSNGGGHGGMGMGTASGTGHSAAVSKGGHSNADPVSVSQSSVSKQEMASHTVGRRVFFQRGSTGYNSQNTGAENEDWRRRHVHTLFGIPFY